MKEKLEKYVNGLSWKELMLLRDALDATIQTECYRAGFENTAGWSEKE